MRWSVLCVAWFLIAAGAPNHAQRGKPHPTASERARATQWVLGPFSRPENAQPVITARRESVFPDPILDKPVHWEALHTFNPAAVVRNGKIYVLYRAEDDSGAMQIGMHTSRLGLAVSEDGVHFAREAAPVVLPGEGQRAGAGMAGGHGGSADCRVAGWRLCHYLHAVESRDVPRGHCDVTRSAYLDQTWSGLRYGQVGRPEVQVGWHCHRVCGERTVHRDEDRNGEERGHYWMYWGEGKIRLATSDDLVHWTPVEDANHQPKVLMRTRPRKFDSGLPEVGPPPVLTKDGIVLLYNGKNCYGSGSRPGACGRYVLGGAGAVCGQRSGDAAGTNREAVLPAEACMGAERAVRGGHHLC